MVERPVLLGDPLGFAAHLDDQGLGGEPQLLGRGDSEGAADEPLYVHGGAGERHRGVQRERQRARPERRVEHARAVPSRGVHEQLPGAHGPGLGEPLHEARQGVVRDGQQHQIRALHDLGRGHQRHVGQQLRGPPYGGVGDSGDGHRAVSGELESRGEGGAHPARADDADGEPRGAVPGIRLLECTHSTAAFPFQSALGTGRCTERFLVMLTRLVPAPFSLSTGCGFPQVAGARKPGCHSERARGIIQG